MADRIVSWDRGFDGDRRQVWGAEKGGYIFGRIVPLWQLASNMEESKGAEQTRP
jgi:hypothetical protein